MWIRSRSLDPYFTQCTDRTIHGMRNKSIFCCAKYRTIMIHVLRITYIIVVDIRPVPDAKLFTLFVRLNIFFLIRKQWITMEFLFTARDLQFSVSQQDVAVPSCPWIARSNHKMKWWIAWFFRRHCAWIRCDIIHWAGKVATQVSSRQVFFPRFFQVDAHVSSFCYYCEATVPFCYGELTLCGDWLSDVRLPNGYNCCVMITTGFLCLYTVEP